MKLIYSLFVLMITLSFIPQIVFAQAIIGDYSFDYVWNTIFVGIFGLDPSWTQPKLFLFNFLLPFIALFAIILGTIRNIRIFPRSPTIEVAIAFIMAFMTLPSKGFILFVNVTLGIAGGFAYILFLGMFFFGSFFFAIGFGHRTLGEAGIWAAYNRERKRLEDEVKKYESDIASAYTNLATMTPGTPGYTAQLDKIKKLEESRQKAQARMADLKTAFQT